MQAKAEFQLTRECESWLQNRTIEDEQITLFGRGERLASEFQAKIHLRYEPYEPTVRVIVRLEDPADGRSIKYAATVLKGAALECKIPLERVETSYCRYSRTKGPESLSEISGLKFIPGRSIKSNDELSILENLQIREFLLSFDPENPNKSTDAMIDEMDYKEVTTGRLEIKGSRPLDYVGTFNGGNPFGYFFVSGTTRIVGEMADDNVCIK